MTAASVVAVVPAPPAVVVAAGSRSSRKKSDFAGFSAIHHCLDEVFNVLLQACGRPQRQTPLPFHEVFYTSTASLRVRVCRPFSTGKHGSMRLHDICTLLCFPIFQLFLHCFGNFKFQSGKL